MKKNFFKNLLLRLSLTLISLCVVLVLMEVLLRQSTTHVRSSNLKGGFSLETTPEKLIQYTSKGRRLVPNADVVVHNHYLSGRDVELKTNAFGFRHPEIEETPNDGEQRILLLGDSITIAEYLPREETYGYVMEKTLQQHDKDTRISVINAGVMDIGIKESIDILEEQGVKIQPSMVILSYYLNDPRPSWGFSKEIRHRGWLRRHSLLAETVYHHIKLQQWIKETGTDRFEWITAKEELNWKDNKKDYESLIEKARYDWGAGWIDEDWKTVKVELERLAALSKKHHFSVMIVMFPVHFQVASNVFDTTPQDTMKELVGEFDFSFLDLLPALRSYHTANPDVEIFHDQCHPTKELSAYIGKEIADYIIKDKTTTMATIKE